MVGILVASHGNLSKGLLEGMNCVMGEQEKVKAFSLSIADDIDAFSLSIRAAVEDFDDGDGVLIFVDLLGGTPCNQAVKLLPSYNVRLVAGANLPMLFAAIDCRAQNLSLADTVQYCTDFGRKGIVDVSTIVDRAKKNGGALGGERKG